ncbi:MAG: hypothetical protein IPL19_18675 [Sandaracinaceae bacterium]|nr:hypothetical protein [Sandaracinaceae bacterium]
MKSVTVRVWSSTVPVVVFGRDDVGRDASDDGEHQQVVEIRAARRGVP